MTLGELRFLLAKLCDQKEEAADWEVLVTDRDKQNGFSLRVEGRKVLLDTMGTQDTCEWY